MVWLKAKNLVYAWLCTSESKRSSSTKELYEVADQVHWPTEPFAGYHVLRVNLYSHVVFLTEMPKFYIVSLYATVQVEIQSSRVN